MRELSTGPDGRRHLPYPSGPYSVGCTDLYVKDSHLLVRCFYPYTSDPKDAEREAHKWVKWYPARQYADGMARFKFGRQLPMVDKMLTWLTHDPYCPIVQDATVAGGSHPVMVFSHGLGGFRSIYSTLISDIASHGYFVAAVEHKDESAAATFKVAENGQLEWIFDRKVQPEEDEYEMRNGQITKRVEECVETLDLLIRLADGQMEADRFIHCRPDPQFLQSLRGKLDFSAPVISGHSFGGATTVKAVTTEAGNEKAKFVQGICYDSWMFPIKNEADDLVGRWEQSATIPKIFFINCETFQGENNLRTMKKFETKTMEIPSNVVTLRKTGHYAPTDVPTIMLGSYAKKPFMFVFGKKTSSEDDPDAFPPDKGLEACCELSSSYLNDNISQREPMKLKAVLAKYEKFLLFGCEHNQKRQEEAANPAN